MPKSILDLTFEFVETFYPDVDPTQDEKKAVLHAISGILERGFTDQEVAYAIAKIDKLNPLEGLVRSFQGRQPKSENLLKPGQFYYHNQLRLMPGPCVVDFDYNTGEIKRIQEPYFLEMRASYTMDDLLSYYARSFDISIGETEKNRYVGSFKWLLKSMTLDKLLFTIDAASNHIRGEDLPIPTSAASISDYKDEADIAYNAKITETKLSGDDVVVARKRVLSSRRRLQAEERGLS